MNRIIITILTLFLFIACSKPQGFNMSEACSECIGEWKWDYSYSASNAVSNISSIGVEFGLTIHADGRMEFFEDGFLVDIYFIKSQRVTRLVNENGIEFIKKFYLLDSTSEYPDSELSIGINIQYLNEFDIIATNLRPMKDEFVNFSGSIITDFRHVYERE